jgi:hypothetical protein
MSDDGSTSDSARGAAMASGRAAPPGLLRNLAHRLTRDAEVLPIERRLASFEGATGWLNSEPLTPEGLRGQSPSAAP